MSRKPKPTRRLYIQYEVADGERVVRCQQVIEKDKLDAMYPSARVHIFASIANDVITSGDLEWERRDAEDHAD